MTPSTRPTREPSQPAAGTPASEPDRRDPVRTPPSRLARHGWPIGVAAVLILSAASNIAVMLVARADPAFAVEPDYYRKAVAWDATMAQDRTNASLGWRADASLVLATPGIPGSIAVSLVGADGAPLTGARLAIEAMHNARASQRYHATLAADGEGRYTAPIDVHRPGVWEVRVTAERGTDRFTQAVRVEAR